MLKQRVITAIILTLVFLAALFGLSPTHFPLFIGAVVLIGAWEWANLSSCGATWQRLAYVGFIGAILLAVSWAIGLYSAEPELNMLIVKSLLIAACAWWAVALLLVQGYPSSAILWGHPLSRLLMGVLVLVPTWLALVYVRFQPQGAWLVVMIAAIVAAADIGGYFTGRKFGKRKLAQRQ
jgi:phosphatidate cytidylyltransferase